MTTCLVKAVHSVNYACLSGRFSNFVCVLLSLFVLRVGCDCINS